jgi:hypothetical protein
MGRENFEYLPLPEDRYKALDSNEMDSDDRYEIRERLHHTLSNGYVIWQGLGIDSKTFETIEKHSDGARQHFNEGEIKKTKRLRQGLIGWLAFLYAGIGEADNVYIGGREKFDVADSLDQVKRVPNIQFDFETMLREAINKVENRRGRYVTDFSLEIETEPIPDSPGGDFDTDRLLTRFNERDPTLTGLEIAHLQHKGAIDGSDWERYNEDTYGSPQERVGGMVGEDTDITEEFRKESDGT